jgi:hypothetical protein
MGIVESKEKEEITSKSKGAGKCFSSKVLEQFIVDVIDQSDPDVTMTEGVALVGTKAPGGVCQSHKQIWIRNQPNAVSYVVERLVSIVGHKGKISLLRFHGHGLSGIQWLWGDSLYKVFTAQQLGKDVAKAEAQLIKEMRSPANRKGISYWNISSISGELGRIRKLLLPGAEVWLMGCEVAAGNEGRQLLQRLSLILDVPVTAATPLQLATLNPQLLSFNYTHETVLGGEVITARPTLRPAGWSRPTTESRFVE